MAKIIFHGAAREVTGSMHLLRINGSLIALDCGLFQGRRAEANTKNRSFPCDPADIDAVILSHAHIDHSGKLPRLVKDGFTGQIHCTFATHDLAAVLLQDSAHIQREDARYMNKKRARRGQKRIEALYGAADATSALQQMAGQAYNRWFQVTDRVRARFFEAGHMLGSAGIVVEAQENKGGTISIAFTGDIGRWGVPILRDPAPIPRCDYIISESTYGGRRSDPVGDMKGRLKRIIIDTVGRGGKVIIPAFSVGRTQTLLYQLNELFAAGELDPLPVFVDSPLAINATDVFKMHPECYDRDASTFFQEARHLLSGPNIHFVREREESKRVTRRRRPAIVIAASGMCEAGRILHHLKHGAKHPRNTIVIVGFQAQHTLGRRIVEGAEFIKVYGEKHRLKARVEVLNGFSSHADTEELKKHLQPHKDTCRTLFLVHGEPSQSIALRTALLQAGYRDVRIPESGQEYALARAKKEE